MANPNLPTVDFNGKEWPSFNQMCRQGFGKSPVTVQHRLNQGWTLKEALLLPPVYFDCKDICPPDMLEAYRFRREERRQQNKNNMRLYARVTQGAREDNIKKHRAKSREELSARAQKVAALMIKALAEDPALEAFEMTALGDDYEACEAMLFRCVLVNHDEREYMFSSTGSGLMYINEQVFEHFAPADFYAALAEIARHGFNGKCKTPNGIFVFLKSCAEIFGKDVEKEEPRDLWLKDNATASASAS